MKTIDSSIAPPASVSWRWRSPWSSLSLYGRLVLVLSTVIVVGAGLFSAYSLRTDARNAMADQQRALEDLAQVLASQVGEYAVLGDYAAIQQRLRAASRPVSIHGIRWTDASGHTIYADGPDPDVVAPDWFCNLLNVTTTPIQHAIEFGSTSYGTLTINLSAVALLNELWQRFKLEATAIGLVISLLVLFVTLLLRGNLRTLGELAIAAERLSQGDTSIQVAETGDPQTAAAARAFNQMASEIKHLISSLTASQKELREQLHFTQELIETLPTPVFFKDRAGSYLGVNKAWEDFYGRPRTDIIGRSVLDLYPDDPDIGRFHHAKDEELWAHPGTQTYELTIPTAMGVPRRAIYYKATFTRASGAVAGLIGSIIDITDRTNAQLELAAEKERAQVTLESIGDGVITTDSEGRVDYLNAVAEKLTGWPAPAALGRDIERVLALVDEALGFPLASPHARCLADGRPLSLNDNTLLISCHGQRLPVEVSAAPIRNRAGVAAGSVIVVRDVSTTRALSQELSWQASHDPLTRLHNRRSFDDCIDRAIQTAQQLDHQHCLLYIDLDQFKIVNDTCGHTAGDELLKQLGPLLQQHVREVDTLARLGGDEFGVLLERCPLQRAMSIANAILSTIKQFRFVYAGKQFTIGASIGIVPINSASGRAADVLSHADIACYAAKDAGRNRLQVYQPDDVEVIQRRGEMQWVARLNHALEHDRFALYYQPIVPVGDQSNAGMHFEILVRLRDESGTIIAPGQFMPAAERFNLMPTIDRWIIQHTLEWLGSNRAQLDALHTCAINLSGHSLSDPSFASMVEEALRATGVPAEKICFEVTETSAIANITRTRALIEQLKSLGCRFSLDDFGTGFSSFTYLKHLPVDYLKIDGSFVRDMIDDPIDHAMVQSIHQIGHVMGVETIAEFVENDAILNRLATVGVNYAQGYGIAAPRPITELFGVEMATAQSA